jgi:hypothetical protein
MSLADPELSARREEGERRKRCTRIWKGDRRNGRTWGAKENEKGRRKRKVRIKRRRWAEGGNGKRVGRKKQEGFDVYRLYQFCVLVDLPTVVSLSSIVVYVNSASVQQGEEEQKEENKIE